MKFKVYPSLSKLKITIPNKKALLKGRNTLCARKQVALIRDSTGDDFGSFEEKTPLGNRIAKLFKRLFPIKPRKKREPKISTATLVGALCAAVSISLLSALLLGATFFLKYGNTYSEVKIPEFISLDASEAIQVAPELFEYELIYERNPEKKEGIVIAQSPYPNIARRLYKSSDKIKIRLTVNSPADTLTLPHLVGSSTREALILLKSIGVNIKLTEEYSDAFSYGSIIYSSLSKGATVKSGDTISLRSSLGRKTVLVSTPELSGLNENQAISLLKAKNLTVGEITYKNSKMPIGTVISQSVAAGTQLPEGRKISFEVSGGIYYQ